MKHTGTYSRKTVNVERVHSNLNQELIQITEDKLRLVLNEHIQHMEDKKSWIAPLSILITLTVVFATTNFIQALFSPDTWEAIFIISSILTGAWLIKAIYTTYRAKTVADLINKIKNSDS